MSFSVTSSTHRIEKGVSSQYYYCFREVGMNNAGSFSGSTPKTFSNVAIREHNFSQMDKMVTSRLCSLIKLAKITAACVIDCSTGKDLKNSQDDCAACSKHILMIHGAFSRHLS